MKKILTIALYLAVIAIGYFEKGLFLEWIRSGGTLSFVISMLFVAILVFFPVMPFVAVAGIIGVIFNVWVGTLISLIGALLGATVMFGLARFGFRDWAQEMLKKYPTAQQFEAKVEEKAFLNILIVRLVPFIPSPAVNVVCGISRVKFPTFFLASLIGKIPSILIFTVAGAQFASNKFLSIGIDVLYMVIVAALAYPQIRKQQQSNS